MSKSLAQPPLVLDNDAFTFSVRVFTSDAASGHVDYIECVQYSGGQPVRSSTHPVSAFQTITPTQKANAKAILQAAYAECFALDGAT